jgi:rRNA maturation protein Nop10
MLIYHFGMNNSPVSGRSSETSSHPINMNNNNKYEKYRIRFPNHTLCVIGFFAGVPARGRSHNQLNAFIYVVALQTSLKNIIRHQTDVKF